MLKLRLLTGPRAGRQMRISDTKPVSVGRRKGRLRLHDSRVSKQHAEIAFEEGVWILRDLGSANGTYINREKVQGLAELEPGDLVQMGRVLIKVTRCDGIGMDTQPELPDDLLGDDLFGGGPMVADTGQDGDLDLDDLFEEEQDGVDEPSETLEAQQAGTESPADASEEEAFEVEADVEVEAEAEAEAPDLLEAAYEEPVDDDDSFFADLSEATDISDGVAIDVKAELQEQDDSQAEEEDPFLSGQAQEEDADEPDDHSDQISLEDESGMGPRSAGTTLLTTVDHDDLVIDEDEEDEGGLSAAEEESGFAAALGAEAEEVEQAEEDEGDAPAVVGLHLDHAPPQQPDAVDELDDESESEAESEAEPEAEAGLESGSGDTFTTEIEDEPLEQLAIDADASDEVVADELGIASSFNFDQEADAEVDLDAQINLEPEPETTESGAEVEAEAEVAIEPEPEPEPAIEPEPELDQEPEPEPEEPVVSEAPAPPADQADTESPSAENTEEDAEEELEGPEFDIDAAFDALSEGLDDSVDLPAIGAEDQDPSGAAAGDAPAEQGPDQHASQGDIPESLVGSQLDVGFIQDALSQLEEGEAPDASGKEPPAAGDDVTKASAAPTLPPTAPGLPQPPPGLNPESVNPPVEPRAYPPHDSGSNRGRWFFTLLLFLGIGGTGGFLISQNYDSLMAIAGRDTGNTGAPSGPTTPGASAPPTGTPQTPPTPTEPVVQTPPVQPTPPVVPTDEGPGQTQDSNPPNTSPDPFAAGPGVLGPDALDGITRNPGSPPPTDPPTNPTTPTPTDPGTAVQPPPTPVDPTPLPPPTDPGDSTAATPPATPQPDSQDTPPAVDQPPARIVFLVDASGSLVDSLPQMIVWLNQALRTIETDERFAIYFFKADQPIAIKPAGMLAPSRELLGQLAKDWLNPEAVPVFPSGRSNPEKSIAQALSHNPTDLYLLSDDAFALSAGSTTAEQALARVRKSLGDSGVRVHGVQFFYRGDDSVLETLANETDGTFEFVRERVVPDAEPIDLLEELGGE